MTVIEVLLLGLMIWEKLRLSARMFKDATYYKVEPKLLDTNTNVMSSISTYNAAKTMKNLASLYTTSKTEEQPMNAVEEHFYRRRHLEKMINFITYEGEK